MRTPNSALLSRPQTMQSRLLSTEVPNAQVRRVAPSLSLLVPSFPVFGESVAPVRQARWALTPKGSSSETIRGKTARGGGRRANGGRNPAGSEARPAAGAKPGRERPGATLLGRSRAPPLCQCLGEDGSSDRALDDRALQGSLRHGLLHGALLHGALDDGPLHGALLFTARLTTALFTARFFTARLAAALLTAFRAILVSFLSVAERARVQRSPALSPAIYGVAGKLDASLVWQRALRKQFSTRDRRWCARWNTSSPGFRGAPR